MKHRTVLCIQWMYFKIISLFESQLLKHSLVGIPPFFGNHLFPWVTLLEQNIKIMQEEMQLVVTRLNDLPNFQDISPENKLLTADSKWKIFPLFAYGITNSDIKNQCPNTIVY